MALFRSYERSSGQLVNTSKSGVYLGKGAIDRQIAIESRTGIRTKTLPLMYLGAPILTGRIRAEHYEYLVTKMRNRLESEMNVFWLENNAS